MVHRIESRGFTEEQVIYTKADELVQYTSTMGISLQDRNIDASKLDKLTKAEIYSVERRVARFGKVYDLYWGHMAPDVGHQVGEAVLIKCKLIKDGDVAVQQDPTYLEDIFNNEEMNDMLAENIGQAFDDQMRLIRSALKAAAPTDGMILSARSDIDRKVFYAAFYRLFVLDDATRNSIARAQFIFDAAQGALILHNNKDTDNNGLDYQIRGDENEVAAVADTVRHPGTDILRGITREKILESDTLVDNIVREYLYQNSAHKDEPIVAPPPATAPAAPVATAPAVATPPAAAPITFSITSVRFNCGAGVIFQFTGDANDIARVEWWYDGKKKSNLTYTTQNQNLSVTGLATLSAKHKKAVVEEINASSDTAVAKAAAKGRAGHGMSYELRVIGSDEKVLATLHATTN